MAWGTEARYFCPQASVHIKGQTECFECKPKPAPKSFPVCTIRNTPDKPIHCIVWAKELLFQRLFGRWARVLLAAAAAYECCWEAVTSYRLFCLGNGCVAANTGEPSCSLRRS